MEQPASFVLDLEAARADVDLQAVRFLLGLIEIVAKHAHGDDPCVRSGRRTGQHPASSH